MEQKKLRPLPAFSEPEWRGSRVTAAAAAAAEMRPDVGMAKQSTPASHLRGRDLNELLLVVMPVRSQNKVRRPSWSPGIRCDPEGCTDVRIEEYIEENMEGNKRVW